MDELNELRHAADLRKKKRWINLSVLGLCVVAALGVLLRSKILFSIPFFDYNRLLDAHFHFAFSGWVTLALVTLLVYDVLPERIHDRPVYQRLLWGIVLTSWLQLFSSNLPPNNPLTSLFSTIFILSTYVFAWVFVKDLGRAGVSKSVFLLSVAGMVSLVLASIGVFVLAYLFATKSLDPGAYRNALYTYLHFEYNGFFTLAVFAIIFNKLERGMAEDAKQRLFRFAVVLCVSVVLSLFLTFLWQDPDIYYKIVALVGSLSLLFASGQFALSIPALKEACKKLNPLVRVMGYLAIAAFLLKTVLQSFTIFPAIGNAVFGDRPVIIGFLHLVFLGFVSLSLMAYFAQYGLLNLKLRITPIALVVFTTGIIINEMVLMTQGLGAMFIKSSYLFPWLLWGISIFLLLGTLLIGISRIRTIRQSN